MNVPIDLQVWTAGECAEYLRESKPYFLRVTRYTPGFPAATSTSEGRNPRWRAEHVINWAIK